jgi:hypothetical protein
LFAFFPVLFFVDEDWLASATCSLKILCNTSQWRTGSDSWVSMKIAPYTPKSHHIYGAISYYMA